MKRLVVTNRHPQAVELVIEPWGDLVTLAPSESVGVSCSESGAGYIDVVAEPGRIALHAEGDKAMELRIDRDAPPRLSS